MADFLSNLAAKNLNLAPLLQPRPLSLFEPEQAVGARNLAPQNTDALHEVSLEQAKAAPSSLHAESNPRISFQEYAAPLPRTDRMDSSAVELYIPPRQTTELPTREFSAAHAVIAHREGWNGEIERVSIPRVESAPLIETVRVERAVIDQEPKNATDTAFTLDARAQILPAAVITPLSTRPTVEDVLTRESRKDALLRAEPAIPNPLVTPLVPMTQLEPVIPKLQTELPQAPPAPTIHVTIGRIEVRAALPNKAAPRGTRPTPMMSLEEYLRRNDKR